jgi:hypothetical protein
MRPGGGPTWCPLFSSSLHFLLTSSSHGLQFSKKNDVAKSLDPSKLKNMQKYENLLRSVKTK